MSISEAERKAAEFAEVEDKISNQLKDKLPAFFKEYQELINFVTDQKNAGEAIGIVQEKVRRLQEEAAEIKKLNQLLMPETFKRRKLNGYLLHNSQNRGDRKTSLSTSVPPSNHYLFDQKRHYQPEIIAFKRTFGRKKSGNIPRFSFGGCSGRVRIGNGEIPGQVAYGAISQLPSCSSDTTRFLGRICLASF